MLYTTKVVALTLEGKRCKVDIVHKDPIIGPVL